MRHNNEEKYKEVSIELLKAFSDPEKINVETVIMMIHLSPEYLLTRKDKAGKTLMRLAAERKDWHLVDKISVNFSSKLKDDQACFYRAFALAIKAKEFDLAFSMLLSHKTMKMNVDFKNGDNLLHFSLQRNAPVEIIRELLSRGLSPHKENQDGVTAFIQASQILLGIMEGEKPFYKDTLIPLIAICPEGLLTRKDKTGKTLIWLAAEKGHWDLVQSIVENFSADLTNDRALFEDDQACFYQAFILALQEEKFEIALLLLSHKKMDTNVFIDEAGTTLWNLAVQKGAPDTIIEKLVIAAEKNDRNLSNHPHSLFSLPPVESSDEEKSQYLRSLLTDDKGRGDFRIEELEVAVSLLLTMKMFYTEDAVGASFSEDELCERRELLFALLSVRLNLLQFQEDFGDSTLDGCLADFFDEEKGSSQSSSWTFDLF